MLSVRTNNAAISAVRSLQKATDLSAAASVRLATGYRINSAMDDAAGLQIATRLRAQASGLAVAMRNMQNTTSLLQAADGVVGNILDVVERMKDLATQAADASTTIQDKTALQGEFSLLYDQILRLHGTQYAGKNLFGFASSPEQVIFSQPLQAQVGDSASETITIDPRMELQDAMQTMLYDTMPGPQNVDHMLTDYASQALDDLNSAIDKWSAVRSVFGASANMLEHAQANASNMLAYTQAAGGRIMDTDYATVAADSTRAQMLGQSSIAMLKQSSSSVQLVMSLIQS